MVGDTPQKITGQESVISRLGYWPEFCDARFLEIQFSRHTEWGAVLSMLLHYIDADKGFDLKVKIVLVGIVHMEFNEFRVENAVDCISLMDSGEDGVKFGIEAAAGLDGECACTAANIELVSIEPWSCGI